MSWAIALRSASAALAQRLMRRGRFIARAGFLCCAARRRGAKAEKSGVGVTTVNQGYLRIQNRLNSRISRVRVGRFAARSATSVRLIEDIKRVDAGWPDSLSSPEARRIEPAAIQFEEIDFKLRGNKPIFGGLAAAAVKRTQHVPKR